jgi:hypothetical protein
LKGWLVWSRVSGNKENGGIKRVRWKGLKHDGKGTTSLPTGTTISKLIITKQSGNLGGLECHKKHLKEVLQNFISTFQYFY